MIQVLRSFEYLEPRTIGEAVRVLSAYGMKAKLLAGGVSLVDSMQRGTIKPECVVSVQRIPKLDYIEGEGTRGSRIGALTTLRSLELSPVIYRHYPFLWEAVHQVASIQVKNMATAVGNLCVASPASDLAPPLLALGARLRIVGLAPEKIIPIEGFFIGVNQTILQPGEIVTEILLPSIPEGAIGTFMKLRRTVTDVAKVNVAVLLTITDVRCKDAKIALGSVAPTVIRAKRAEDILKGHKLEPKIIIAAARAAAEEAKPITDVRSTAQYRTEMVEVLVRRVIDRILEKAKA